MTTIANMISAVAEMEETGLAACIEAYRDAATAFAEGNLAAGDAMAAAAGAIEGFVGDDVWDITGAIDADVFAA